MLLLVFGIEGRGSWQSNKPARVVSVEQIVALLKGSPIRGTHTVAIHNSTNCGRWCVSSASAQRTTEDVKEFMAGIKIFVNYLRVK